MNDGIMNTWEVVDQNGLTIWNCARQETAEYLCSWENALIEYHARKYAESNSFDYRAIVDRMNLFRVVEGE